MSCALFRRHIDAFIDGEVDPRTQIEFDRHVDVCPACQEQLAFERSMKEQVRAALAGDVAPEHLRTRIIAALDAEEQSWNAQVAVEQESRPAIRFLPMRARHAVPVAIAATVLLAASWWNTGFFGFGADGRAADAHGSGGATTGLAERGGAALPMTAGMTNSMPIFEDVVRVHSSALPADVEAEPREAAEGTPGKVSSYFRNKVEFPVRPAVFDRSDARLVGGRLSNVRERQAAALYYDVSGHRLTMVVFDRGGGFERSALRTQMLGRDLYYQQVNGYVVPVRRHDGLTYALTGDLDRHSLLHLAATMRVRY